MLVFTGYHGYKTVSLLLRVWGLFILNLCHNLLIRFTKNSREIISLTPNRLYPSRLFVSVTGHYFQRQWNRPGWLAFHRTMLLAVLLPVMSRWLHIRLITSFWFLPWCQAQLMIKWVVFVLQIHLLLSFFKRKVLTFFSPLGLHCSSWLLLCSGRCLCIVAKSMNLWVKQFSFCEYAQLFKMGTCWVRNRTYSGKITSNAPLHVFNARELHRC